MENRTERGGYKFPQFQSISRSNSNSERELRISPIPIDKPFQFQTLIPTSCLRSPHEADEGLQGRILLRFVISSQLSVESSSYCSSFLLVLIFFYFVEKDFFFFPFPVNFLGFQLFFWWPICCRGAAGGIERHCCQVPRSSTGMWHSWFPLFSYWS